MNRKFRYVFSIILCSFMIMVSFDFMFKIEKPTERSIRFTKLINVDSDENKEIITVKDSIIEIYDDNSNKIRNIYLNGEQVESFFIVDLNTNGIEEFLIYYKDCISYFNEEWIPEWNFQLHPYYILSGFQPEVIDLDKDGKNEIIFYQDTGLIVLDRYGNFLWDSFGNEKTIFKNIVGDERLEIINNEGYICNCYGELIIDPDSELSKGIRFGNDYQVINIDDDPEYEIRLITLDFIMVFDNLIIKDRIPLGSLKLSYRLQYDSSHTIFYNHSDILYLNEYNEMKKIKHIENNTIKYVSYFTYTETNERKVFLEISCDNITEMLWVDSTNDTILFSKYFSNIGEYYYSILDINGDDQNEIIIFNNNTNKMFVFNDKGEKLSEHFIPAFRSSYKTSTHYNEYNNEFFLIFLIINNSNRQLNIFNILDNFTFPIIYEDYYNIILLKMFEDKIFFTLTDRLILIFDKYGNIQVKIEFNQYKFDSNENVIIYEDKLIIGTNQLYVFDIYNISGNFSI